VPMTGARAALARPAVEVAPLLLGRRLRHVTAAGIVTVELTEVEAYEGQADPASHAYRGRSPRNAVMFGEAGRLYVYRSYGLHWCCNVVTGVDGTASAVLLRAGRVVEGADLARSRRGERVTDRGLARGPACLTQALAITSEHDGADLLGAGPLTLSPAGGDPAQPAGPAEVAAGPRVGVSRAHEVPWRFWLPAEASVSAYRRRPRAG
jgi:DNA-3-methyladenine glycosylase